MHSRIEKIMGKGMWAGLSKTYAVTGSFTLGHQREQRPAGREELELSRRNKNGKHQTGRRGRVGKS